MVKIISDSTCDLSQEVLEKYDIDIIPLHIVKGNEELEDGPAIDISALYKWADENKTTPKTSAPSIETAMNIMRPYIKAGREIICFSISGEMSTSGNVIRMAAEELEAEDAVTVIREICQRESVCLSWKLQLWRQTENRVKKSEIEFQN